MLASASGITTLVVMFWFQFLTGAYSATFQLINKCSYTVWPGILSGAGAPPLSTTGFTLQSGDSIIISVPPGWSGQLWGRTLCSHDATGKFSCVTGDCGSSTVECCGRKAVPPVTLVEFTVNGRSGENLLEVSVVEGFNLPVTVDADGSGKRERRGCTRNLNEACPAELKVKIGGDTVACKAETSNCTMYSHFFKSGCPGARVYAYDPPSTTASDFTHYTIAFCLNHTTSSSDWMKSIKGPKGVAKGAMAVFAVVVSVLGLIGCAVKFNISCGRYTISAEAQTGV